MADTQTTHLNLIKQDENAVPDYEKDHINLDTLDTEIWNRGKAFNGTTVGEDGGFHVRSIPYAENIETSQSQRSEGTYLIRTSGGEASLQDGDAWLTQLKGARVHTGYVPQSIGMTVTPMARTAPPAITATLDETTFEAYVGEAGTYTITYTTEWSTSPTLYGLTVSNTPVSGDEIIMVWDGNSNADVTVNAAERPVPESISATIDDSTFVAYVAQSGTTTLTYSTGWSADLNNYGITVTGTPIAGDVITIVYQKEVRGTITQSTPATFVSTGWNLYNHTSTYARVIKYSDDFGFMITGAYTSLAFVYEYGSSDQREISPVNNWFNPFEASDPIGTTGYVLVTGGNSTTTQIWMTWSDWSAQANGGTFAPYSETVVDISSFMSTNFPYGLLQTGTVRDEINLNVGIATSNVARQVYNSTNLANAKASGLQYEYDEDYIYIERATPVTYTIEVDGGYSAYDHGLEMFTGTTQGLFAQTLYGSNLKNKLERDVLTISQQSLSAAEKAQVQENLGLNNVAHTTGNESIGGNKTFTGNVIAKGSLMANNSTTNPYVSFRGSSLNDTGATIQANGAETSGGKFGNPRFVFYQYSPSSDGTSRTSYSDRYLLPAVDSGKTANNDYNILTSKSAVTVGQGGTGATSAANARTNLGVPPTSHATTATTYGVGTGTNYGHVKLSDTYSGTPSTSARAANSIAASQYAVQMAYSKCPGYVKQSWGTSITVPGTHAIVLIGATTQLLVWLSSETSVGVSVTHWDSSGISGFYKSGTNSVTFSASSSTGTNYTLTRSGSAFTLTSGSNATMTAIYAYGEK